MIHPLTTAKRAFEHEGHTVSFMPMLLYFQQHVTEEQRLQVILEALRDTAPDVVLWWNWAVPPNVLRALKEHLACSALKMTHVMFNWDHPSCISEVGGQVRCAHLFQHSIWDHVFLTSGVRHDLFLNAGCKSVHYLRTFADPTIHFPEKDDAYACDVSFVLTNLYADAAEFPGQLCSRPELLAAIIEDGTLDLKIYGPSFLQEAFPNHYGGMVSYTDNHKVFSNSKVNLCTHGVNGADYVNERVGTILSSGGLLLCDRVEGIDRILTDGVDAVLMDRSHAAQDVLQQIKHIVANNAAYDVVRENAVQTARAKFSPAHWTKAILSTCTAPDK